MLVTVFDGPFHRGFKLFIERQHHIRPFLVTLGNLIEVLLHLGGEVIVHDLRKVLHQEVIHHHTDIRWKELSLLRADNLLA